MRNGVVALFLASALLGCVDRAYAESADSIFQKILVIGADVSNNERVKSPGRLIGEQAGLGDERIITVGKDGAKSADHYPWLRESLAVAKPTLVIAFDLFFHDFKRAAWFWKNDRKRVDEIVGMMATTGHQVYLGNTVPTTVCVGPLQVNSELTALQKKYPNLHVIDLFKMFKDSIINGGYDYSIGGKTFRIVMSDVIDEQKRPNQYGFTLAANFLMKIIKEKNPEITNEQLPYIEVTRPNRGPQIGGSPLMSIFDHPVTVSRLRALH